MSKTRRYLLILMLIAYTLRLFHLGEQSLWYDEGVSWYLTRFSLPDLIRWTAADIQPPLYYLILWFSTRLFGQSEWALRFPSVIFGTLTIPVMWQLGRLLFGRSTARTLNATTLAALFTAFAPLMVYYSQEARMYSLLVLEAALGSYFLLRIIAGRRTRRNSVAYIAIMAAALYTHYFSAFLLAAHFVYLTTLYFQERRSAHSSFVIRHSSFAIFAGILLLFLPWIPILLARLGDDPSYWPGALKLSEAVQDVFISFAAGGKREMIWEAAGLPLAAVFGVLLALSIILLARPKNNHRPVRQAQGRPLTADRRNHSGSPAHSPTRSPAHLPTCLPAHPPTRSPAHLLFLLLWLIIPIAGVILLSYQTPKFNPRYTMLAWPAFALILSGGLAKLTCIGGRRSAVGGLIALVFIAFAWAFSLHNWFTDEDFRKDDFQALAQFVQERFTPGDTVLLSSGHLFPVWQYYYGGDGWTPLPEMQTLDVNRAANFSILPKLETALQGHSGVWLVTWQNEVIDPNGVVPLILDSVGERLDDEFHYGDFIGVGLDYWRLPNSPIFPGDYPADIRSDYNFGNLVVLRGLLQTPGSHAEATLYWEALQPLTEDYQISLRLVDDAGVNWSAGSRVSRPANYLYPAQRWPVGEIVAGRQTLPWLSASPPGDYWLEIGWLTEAGEGIDALDANGNPQRRTVLLGPITIAEPIAPPPVENSTPLRVGNLDLLFGVFEETKIEAGGKVIFDALWRVDNSPAGDGPAYTAWLDSAGNAYPLEAPARIAADFPPGSVFRSRHKLTTPYQAAPGLVLLQARSEINADNSLAVGSLTLLPTERNFVPPEDLDVESGANFANLARLLGANIESTNLTLYWESLAPFEADYTIFVHLLGPDGTPVLIADHDPPRPTGNWIEGEIIADPVTLTLPAELPPGSYPLEVGLYNKADPNLARLPLADSAANYVILTEIEMLSNGE